MKTKQIKKLDGFTGTILIPVYETNAKSIVPIEYHGVTVAAKVFYGKKDTHYLVEKYDCTHVFIGLGKEIGVGLSPNHRIKPGRDVGRQNPLLVTHRDGQV